jgi:hypothetical protein
MLSMGKSETLTLFIMQCQEWDFREESCRLWDYKNQLSFIICEWLRLEKHPGIYLLEYSDKFKVLTGKIFRCIFY